MTCQENNSNLQEESITDNVTKTEELEFLPTDRD